VQEKNAVLIIDHNPILRDLNELILSEAGYEVALVPLNTDPVQLAASTHPHVIVISIDLTNPDGWEIVDRLEAGQATELIPVVVISTTQRTAVEARIAPNVCETVVAPYDIDALRDAVARAIGNPPAAALLPEPYQVAPPAVAFAASLLTRNSRTLILRVLRQLQEIEPFHSRFGELSPGLIDNVPKIYGTLTTALHRGLTPSQLTDTPEIRRVIGEHVRLREAQGLQPAPVIQEYQVIQGVTLRFLRSNIDDRFTALEAFDVALLINSLIDHIIRVAVEDFQAFPRML